MYLVLRTYYLLSSFIYLLTYLLLLKQLFKLYLDCDYNIETF